MIAKKEAVVWEELNVQTDEDGEVLDRVSSLSETHYSAEGFRLVWYHSVQKAERDAHARETRLSRTVQALSELHDKLHSPRTRYRRREKVEKAVAEILQRFDTQQLVDVCVNERIVERYRQARRGRPGKDTQYVKTETTYYDIQWERNVEHCNREEQTDGIFPLITNVKEMHPLEVLQAYKRQPIIEKRFSQLKTDFVVAPVYLKNVARIEALLCVYFFVLLIQTLLERELRLAMDSHGLDELPLYPEGRPCRCPTTRRLIDVFDGVQRHQLTVNRHKEHFATALTPLQKLLLDLLELPATDYALR